MPLLARMLTSPLVVQIQAGVVEGVPALLRDRHISAEGTVLVVVGQSQGQRIWDTLSPMLPNAEVFTVTSGSLAAASDLQTRLSERFFDALVAVGGGRTLDVAKHAATRAAVPVVAVATNLSHDGICSPVSSLETPDGKASFGVTMPLAVSVDLDYVRRAPPALVRSGVGDAVSNLSAIADWELAQRQREVRMDGLAVAFARNAGEAILHRPDTIDDDGFLTTLAEALVLSGMAMSVAGTSRPCSGACHEIIHAVDSLFPDLSNHGELAGIGALFATHLRGDTVLRDRIAGCLARHGLPRTRSDIGLSAEEFTAALELAPRTRPGRYTILEHLGLNQDQIRAQVEEFDATFAS